jgi:2',3'-cyclic-nucleotide 2'-phosphodiesterase
MRILICGDVVGRSGRTVVLEQVKRLRAELALDFFIVNGENAAGGAGITPKICDQFFDAGVDAITTGNHVFDQREIIPHFDREKRLLRPQNYPRATPGTGVAVFPATRGRKVLIVHVMTRLFMNPLDDPFACAAEALETHHLKRNGIDAIVFDVHGEASSEKMAMAHFVDGRASVVVGTHSHIPTADAHILTGGTAYQTDIGMCGDYDSVIGMKKPVAVERFVRKMPTARLEAADGKATLCATFVETDDATGLALRVEPLRYGGILPQTMPE